MDLTKVFDTLDHDLLLERLNAYSFSFNAINLFKAICQMIQRLTIWLTYDSWSRYFLEPIRGLLFSSKTIKDLF